MGQFTSLAALSKNLYNDKEMIEMRQEIELLKLKLFWTNHHIDKFQDCMKMLNQFKCKCNCENCQYNLHIETFDPSKVYDSECKLVPYIQKIMSEFDMKFFMIPQRYYGIKCDETYDVDQEALKITNSHFLVGDWVIQLRYGPKLSNAKSVNDPELLKLKAFFDFALPHSIQKREDILLSTNDYCMSALY